MNSTNINKELECARKILQKCSGGKNSSVAIGKQKKISKNNIACTIFSKCLKTGDPAPMIITITYVVSIKWYFINGI